MSVTLTALELAHHAAILEAVACLIGAAAMTAGALLSDTQPTRATLLILIGGACLIAATCTP